MRVLPIRPARESFPPFALQIVVLPSLSSAPQNVNHGENNHPHCINKMPIERKNFDARGLLWPDATRHAKQKHDREHEQTCGHMKTVQTDKRVVGSSKKVGGNGQSPFVDQPMPFLASSVKKQATQSNREEAQAQKCGRLTAL